ncbi:hypothetical protein TNCV_1322991 [Trichonephila clavipes]|nr:hypothetical protein TNCV_1322991 [Trichonephila clavipes]
MYAQNVEEKRAAAANLRAEVIRIQITMAIRRVLTIWSMIEVSAVIQYEWTYGTSVLVNLEHLHNVYNEAIMSRQMVGHCCCMFNAGRQNV